MSKKRKAAAKERRSRRGGERGFNRASGTVHRVLSRLLSSIRLSLTFRIALHYCGQLLRTTLPTLLGVSAVLALLQVPFIRQDMTRLEAAPVPENGVFTQAEVQNSRAAAYLTAWPEGGEGGVAFHLHPLEMILTTPHQSGNMLVVTYDLRDAALCWLMLMATLLSCDVLRLIAFLRRHRRLDRRVLSPIRDITDMAATLSASNLSNRINVAGMKNELKDLATVINTMLDRIERSYNSQKQFVSDASHELRTPIAVIQGYIGMLNRWGKDDPTVLEEGMEAIAQETASMKELVESLLFLARHDKKTLMMETSRFDALDVVAEVHKEAAMVTPADTFRLAPSEHCLVNADRGMIKQVLRILCDNAVKYTPKGGEITMGVERRGETCVLTMQDNGPGIPAQELPKIFERFYRSDSARKAENGGHGLGLSIARIIVMAHGGKLRVRSKVGVGTVFAVELPAENTGTAA